MERFEVFASFYDKAQAEEVASLMETQQIPCMVTEEKRILSNYIVGEMDAPPFQVKISNIDFSRAKQLLQNYYETHIHEIDPGHYLHSFSATELMEILQKPDEWNAQDIVIARKLLAGQGINLPGEEVARYNAERIKTLSKPEKTGTVNYIIGYLFAITIPLVGIFYALYFRNSRKLLPDGSRVMTYDKSVRTQASLILLVSSIMLILMACDMIFFHQLPFSLFSL